MSHVEWVVTDLDRAVAFLSGLFGWRFQVFSRHYRLYTPERGVCVGLMEAADVSPGYSPMVYVQVADLDATLARAEALGGRIRTARVEIADYGEYAQVLDPDGNLIGLFQGPSTR